MKLKKFTKFNEELINDWTKLENNELGVFSSILFHKEFHRIKKSRFVCFLITDEHDAPLALLPLEQKSFYFLKKYSGHGHRICDYQGFIFNKNITCEDDKLRIVLFVISHLKGNEIVIIDHFLDEKLFVRLPKKFRLGVKLITKKFIFDSKNALGDPGLILSSKMRKNMRRDYRALEKIGSVEFVFNPSNQELREKILLALFEFKTKRFKQTGARNILNKKNKLILKKLFENKNKSFILSAFLLNKKVIACSADFHDGKKIFYWFTGYENSEKLKNIALGNLYLLYMFQQSINDKLTEFDFLLGDEVYKDRFSNSRSYVFQIVLYRTNVGKVLKFFFKTFYFLFYNKNLRSIYRLIKKKFLGKH